MGKKIIGKRSKKVDILKKRKKILQQSKKKHRKEDVKVEKKKTEKEEKLEIRLEKETKLYWVRAIMGPSTAFIGRLLLGLVGWSLLFWMLAFWFGFPFFVSFVLLRYQYDEEEWNWKNIIKPGIGIFFFTFMIVGVFLHTMLKFM